MTNKKHLVTRRTVTHDEFIGMFAPGVLEDFERRNKTMGPFEPDPSNRTPEEEARLDRWIEGYCASGHDPTYTGPAEDE